MNMSLRTLNAAALVGVLVASAGLIAGPLTPPAGPVAPTYKTLAEVQPRTAVQSLPGNATALHVISQPGSYYLTGNINGVSGKHGIRIEASNVSIDLCGFSLSGGGVGRSAIDAYTPPPAGPRSGISIRNGSIDAWQDAGVFAPGATACVIESLSVTSAGLVGIRVAGGSVVRS